MIKKSYILYIIAVLLVFSACSKTNTVLGPKREVISYEEKILDINASPELDITADSCDLQIYSWKENRIKLEITKRVRGVKSDEELEKSIKNFDISVKSEDNKVVFKSDYRREIKSPADIGVDLKVYLPRNMQAISLYIDVGKIKFHDDISCLLKAQIGTANMDINRFNGIIDCNLDMGDTRIYAGELKGGSSIKTNMGNISLKSKVAFPGEYVFESGMGNIDLVIERSTLLDLEYVGNLQVNEFDNNPSGARVKIKSNMGRISIKKY